MDSSHSTKLSKHGELTGQPDYPFANVASPTPIPSTLDKLTLALDVRRHAIGLTTLAAVVVIAGLTAVFHHGLELRQYDAKAMAQKQRDGTSTTDTRLLILRFLANALLQPEPKWHVGVLAIGLSAALGFLLSSGFDALNVQLRDLEVQPVIDLSDLSILVNQEAIIATNLSTVNKTFAETQINNSIANTVLRGVVLPTVYKVAPLCDLNDVAQRAIDDSVVYGFPQQDWMKYMLPHALNAKTLPLLSKSYIPWGKLGEWTEKVKPDVVGNFPAKETIGAGNFPRVVSNLRKFHTFTVSRIVWTPQNLAAKYNAKCGVASGGGCMGLDFELTNGKRLVVGADSLAFSNLGPLAYDYSFKEKALYPTRLVTVTEPPIPNSRDIPNKDFYYRTTLAP